MKKHFNKELVMTKENDKDFENSSKCCISHNFYVNGDVKIRDHCHFTGKYKCCLHRDCNISVKLNHKIPFLLLQEISKSNLETNVTSNELKKYMSFNITNKLSFIDSYLFLSSSLVYLKI